MKTASEPKHWITQITIPLFLLIAELCLPHTFCITYAIILRTTNKENSKKRDNSKKKKVPNKMNQLEKPQFFFSCVNTHADRGK